MEGQMRILALLPHHEGTAAAMVGHQQVRNVTPADDMTTLQERLMKAEEEPVFIEEDLARPDPWGATLNDTIVQLNASLDRIAQMVQAAQVQLRSLPVPRA